MKNNLLYLGIALCVATLSSCNKGDTGDTGPTGATGPTGNVNVVVYTDTIPGNGWTLNVEGQAVGVPPTINSTSIQTLETALDVEIYLSVDRALANARRFR